MFKMIFRGLPWFAQLSRNYNHLPRPRDVPLEIRTGLRVLLLSESNNNMTRRIQYELNMKKANCRTEIVNKPECMIQAVDRFRPDIIVCPFMKMFVPEDIYKVKERPCLIVHPGVPGDRGASALDWAILAGENQWGVTVLEATEVYDGGDIWSTKTIDVPKHASKTSLYNGAITDAAVECSVDAVSRYCQGIQHYSVGKRASEITGSFHKNIKHSDRWIFWDSTAQEVEARIRMSDTVPGAIAEFKQFFDVQGFGGKRFRLFDGYVEDGSTSEYVRQLMDVAKPGHIVATKDRSILVKTGDDNGVWIGQMKQMVKTPAVKLPSTYFLPEPLLQDLPVISDPCPHDSVTYSVSGGVCTVKFDFYNGAMDTEQARRLQETLKFVASMEEVKVVALIGGERFFSTGIHLCVIQESPSIENEAYRNITAIDDVVKAIFSMTTKATVAVLRGNAGAGGAMIACACDVIITHPSVVLTPTYKSMHLFGSEYWTYFLPRRVGAKMAAKLTTSLDSYLAEEARQIGLVDTVLGSSKAEFYDMYPQFLQEVLESGHAEMLIDKKTTERTDDWFTTLSQYRARELMNMRANFRSPAFLNAMKNFVYKTQNTVPEQKQAGNIRCLNAMKIF